MAEWLSNNGHDVVEAQIVGPDPGDTALLELAESENPVLVTMDKDFGEFHLPAQSLPRRIDTVARCIEALEDRAIVTI